MSATGVAEPPLEWQALKELQRNERLAFFVDGYHAGVRSGVSVGTDIGAGAAFAALSVAESLADGLIGGSKAPRGRRQQTSPF